MFSVPRNACPFREDPLPAPSQDHRNSAADNLAKQRVLRLCAVRCPLSVQTDHVDCLLIHWPGAAKTDSASPRNKAARLATWRALEVLYERARIGPSHEVACCLSLKTQPRSLRRFYVPCFTLSYTLSLSLGLPLSPTRLLAHRQGAARSIGVSNFTEAHLGELLAECTVRPAVNQAGPAPPAPAQLENPRVARCALRAVASATRRRVFLATFRKKLLAHKRASGRSLVQPRHARATHPGSHWPLLWVGRVQVEVHPQLPQRALAQKCAEEGVTVVAYSPLGAVRSLLLRSFHSLVGERLPIDETSGALRYPCSWAGFFPVAVPNAPRRLHTRRRESF